MPDTATSEQQTIEHDGPIATGRLAAISFLLEMAAKGIETIDLDNIGPEDAGEWFDAIERSMWVLEKLSRDLDRRYWNDKPPGAKAHALYRAKFGRSNNE